MLVNNHLERGTTILHVPSGELLETANLVEMHLRQTATQFRRNAWAKVDQQNMCAAGFTEISFVINRWTKIHIIPDDDVVLLGDMHDEESGAEDGIDQMFRDKYEKKKPKWVPPDYYTGIGEWLKKRNGEQPKRTQEYYDEMAKTLPPVPPETPPPPKTPPPPATPERTSSNSPSNTRAKRNDRQRLRSGLRPKRR